MGWMIVIALGVVSTLVAFTAKMVSIEKLGPTKAAIGNTLEPVFTLLLAVLFLSENLGPAQLIGASLVVLAVGILPLKRRADEVSAAPAPIK
jgi:drug/metabolite transporter (DMT)-like permease